MNINVYFQEVLPGFPREVRATVLIPGNKIRVRALSFVNLQIQSERHALSGAWKFVTVAVGPAGAFVVLIGYIFVAVQIQNLSVGPIFQFLANNDREYFVHLETNAGTA